MLQVHFICAVVTYEVLVPMPQKRNRRAKKAVHHTICKLCNLKLLSQGSAVLRPTDICVHRPPAPGRQGGESFLISCFVTRQPDQTLILQK